MVLTAYSALLCSRNLSVAVEYSITELRRTLHVPLGAAFDWAIDHLDEIEQAQETYDKQ